MAGGPGQGFPAGLWAVPADGFDFFLPTFGSNYQHGTCSCSNAVNDTSQTAVIRPDVCRMFAGWRLNGWMFEAIATTATV